MSEPTPQEVEVPEGPDIGQMPLHVVPDGEEDE